MTIGKFELSMVVVMTLAIISMSFTFPAMGLTGDAADDDDIPEFSLETDRYDFTDEFPDPPHNPSSGTLVWDDDDPAGKVHGNVVWLDGDTDDGTELVLLNETVDGEPRPNIRMNNWDNGFESQENYTFEDMGDFHNFEDTYGYTILTQPSVFEPNTTHWEIEWMIHEQPGDQVWYNRIPVVGTVIGAGEQLAGIVGWIGSVILWGVTWLFEISMNLLHILIDVLVYLGEMMLWIGSTYADIIEGANSWAGVFAAIPGVIIGVVFAKIVLGFILALPTT